MADTAAILAGLAAAAPGAVKGIQNVRGMIAQHDLKQEEPKLTQQVSSGLPSFNVQPMSPTQLDAGQNGSTAVPPAKPTAIPAHPMAQPNHPFWDVMGKLAGDSPPVAPGAAASPTGPVGTNMDGTAEFPAPGQTWSNGMGNTTSVTPPAAAAAPQALATGGVVRENFGRPTSMPEFMGYQAGGVINSARNSSRAIPMPITGDGGGTGGGVIPASTEGQILTMAGGGAVPVLAGGIAPAGSAGGFSPNSEAVSPPMTGGGAGFVAGMAEGQNIGHNIQQAWLAHEAREANAQASDAANYGPNQQAEQAAQSAQAAAQPSMLDRARDAVEGFFQHLHDHTLGKNNKPNNQQAIDTQGSASPNGQPAPKSALPTDTKAATQAAGVAATQAVQQGASPQQAQATAQKAASTTAQAVGAQEAQQDAASGGPPKLPHSQTTDYWTESNRKMIAAAHAMALAGENPFLGMQAMQAARTAHYQGQIQRYLSGANVALMNGDTAQLKQNLENINYYLPNGKGLKFRTATQQDVANKLADHAGQLMFENPMASLYGHEGEPEWQAANAQNLQLLGQAALDPQTVQSTILSTYSAEMAAQAKEEAARGAELTGEGRDYWGKGEYNNSIAKLQLVPIQKYLSFAMGKRAEAEANYYNNRAPTAGLMGPKVTFTQVAAAQKQTVDLVQNLFQGQLRSNVEPKDINGLPNPSYGKSVHDPNTVPTLFKGMSSDQQDAVERMGSQLAGANLGTMSPMAAAEMAARIVRAHDSHVPPTHIDPKTKKPVRDVIFDPKNNTVHVWVGNAWENAYLQPNAVAQVSAISAGIAPPDTGAGERFVLGGGGNSNPGAASGMYGQ